MKMYSESAVDMDIHVPERKREDIKRFRHECEHDRHVSKEKNKDIIDFCKGTGLRRHELAALELGHILFMEDKVYVWGRQGKGGKHRIVEVLEEYKEHVRTYSKVTTERVFKKCLRIWMCIVIELKNYCRKEKSGNVYDKQAMLKVSKLLGHNRKNVIANNYLWNY